MIKFDLQTFAEGESAQIVDAGAENGAGTEGANGTGTESGNAKANDAGTENKTVFGTQGGNAAQAEILDFGKVTIPEGITVDDNFKALAKDIGLTNDGASKLLAYAKSDIFDRIATAQQEAQKEVLDGWAKESQTQYSGDKLEIAKHAYKTFASEGLQKFMDDTGLGSHPEVVGLFYKLGLQMSEGKLVLGDGHDNPNSANTMFAKSISMMGK